MRDMPAEWSGEFDAIISIWNSFGYFADDHENQRVLASAAQALKPGGRLLIDVSNRDRVVSTYRARDWDERDGLVLLQERSFDPVRGLNRTELILARGRTAAPGEAGSASLHGDGADADGRGRRAAAGRVLRRLDRCRVDTREPAYHPGCRETVGAHG